MWEEYIIHLYCLEEFTIKKNYAYILNIILFDFLFIQKKMKVSIYVIFAADRIERGMMTL